MATATRATVTTILLVWAAGDDIGGDTGRSDKVATGASAMVVTTVMTDDGANAHG